MYQLTDVFDVDNMQPKKDAWHLIGKEYEVTNLRVGEKAVLNNLTDSHMYRRVTRTSIIDGIKVSMKEIRLIAQDSIYVLKKL